MLGYCKVMSILYSLNIILTSFYLQGSYICDAEDEENIKKLTNNKTCVDGKYKAFKLWKLGRRLHQDVEAVNI